MVNVKGRWALITGASRGIGYLTAIFMARQGCNLILHSRTLEGTQKVKAEVEALGVSAHAVAAELNDLAAVEAMLSQIDALNVPVDIVLNNAGLQIAYRNEYLTTPKEDYLVSFNVNTIAPMMICYHFLPKMQERGFGRILNTTSGISLDPQQAGYRLLPRISCRSYCSCKRVPAAAQKQNLHHRSKPAGRRYAHHLGTV